VDAIEPMGEPHDVEKAALILAGREASARRGATDAEEGEAITPTSPSSSSSSSPVPSSEIAGSRTPYTAASGVELGTTPLVHRRKVV
jgi:hypothetical protein